VHIGIRIWTVEVSVVPAIAAHQLWVDFNGWNGSTSVMHLLWEAAPEPNQVADISRILSKYVVDLQAHIHEKINLIRLFVCALHLERPIIND
jgi:hypothetical protein